STFFLNIHWFMDKTGRTGSTAQFINGIFLLSAFFGVRLVYGGKVVRGQCRVWGEADAAQSFDFMCTLLEVRHEIPWIYTIVFGVGNLVLTGLNWLWFTKMISALRRRFDDGDGKGGERGGLANGAANGYGTGN
ncbi:hypothetical protein C0993_012814, partial [Termitomyces sp. T159_Od127]